MVANIAAVVQYYHINMIIIMNSHAEVHMDRASLLMKARVEGSELGRGLFWLGI